MPLNLRRPRSLRFRVAFALAWFGALVSMLLAIGLYFAADDLGNRLMDETLRAQMDDYLARRARNPQSLPPNTAMLRGHTFTPGRAPEAVPPEVRDLPPGQAEVLVDDSSLNDRQRQRVERIGRASRDMIELTTALLLMAREATAGAQPDELCPVRDVLLDCVDKHRHLLEGRAAALDLDVVDTPRLAAERTLLSIVIGNLIRNAFSYTETGTVVIRLLADRLIVSDTGIGIKADELARVFQRYYKGSTSKGAGIGLSLVKRICDRYGWDVLIESRENEGTTAQLIFPATRAS
jgi:signal transduction histidine kinase